MRYDVVICGGGLAGLCLARQLILENNKLQIAIIDALSSEIPKSAWKVGESSVELGAHYLRNHLQLGQYLEKNHLLKRGLRFFFDGSKTSLEQRPELGSSTASPFVTYQIDRGILESDLRRYFEMTGVTFFDECKVTDLHFNETEDHIIEYRNKDNAINKIQARWVVDASGRRRLIQKKLGLGLPSKSTAHSSAWFRIEGILATDDLVDASNVDWHKRVPNRKRHLATNHFVGDGYWVWIIPLSGDATSIGIVVCEDIHAIESINSQEKSLEWLRKHEPILADALADKSMIDFRCLKDYSYTSTKVFSTNRWACVGEAAVFADPFYSPGLDFIAMTNTITTKLIKDDFAGRLSENDVAVYSKYIILLNDQITKFHQHGYTYFASEVVTAARVLWDVSAAWGYMCLMFFNHVVIDPNKSSAIRGVKSVSYFTLASKAYKLFDDWKEARDGGMGRFTYDFFDYLSLEWLLSFRKNNLTEYTTNEELAKQYQENMFFYQALIMAFYYLALDDIYPEKIKLLDQYRGLKIESIDLHNPEKCLVDDLDDTVEKYGPMRIYEEIKSKFFNKNERVV